jgi:hypothetical protein
MFVHQVCSPIVFIRFIHQSLRVWLLVGVCVGNVWGRGGEVAVARLREKVE